MTIPDMTLPQLVFGTIVMVGFGAFVATLTFAQIYTAGAKAKATRVEKPARSHDMHPGLGSPA